MKPRLLASAASATACVSVTAGSARSMGSRQGDREGNRAEGLGDRPLSACMAQAAHLERLEWLQAICHWTDYPIGADMNIVTLKCPNCGGEIELEDGLEIMYCKYCGSKLMVDGMSDGMVNARVRLREMDHEERMWDKETEFEKFTLLAKMKNKHLEMLWIFVPVLLMSVLFTALECSHSSKVAKLERIEEEVVSAVEEQDYDLALIKANQLRLDDGYSKEASKAWDDKREEYVKIINKKIAERDKEQNASENNEAGRGKEKDGADGDDDKPWWHFW